MVAPSPAVLPQIFMSMSLHVLALGVFLLVVKMTLWKEIPLASKIIFLGILYFVYIKAIAPNVDPLTRIILNLPPEEASMVAPGPEVLPVPH